SVRTDARILRLPPAAARRDRRAAGQCAGRGNSRRHGRTHRIDVRSVGLGHPERKEQRMNHGKLLIAGEWIEAAATEPVLDKFSGAEVARLGVADEAQTAAAVRAARAAFAAGPLHPYRRYEILTEAAGLLKARKDE